MRSHLIQLQGTRKIVKLFTRQEVTEAFVATVERVDVDTVLLHTYDEDFQKWGEIVLAIQDLYRIDLQSVEMQKRLFQRCMDVTADAET